jgi:hypothetical protein
MCCLGAVSYHGLCGQPVDHAAAFAWWASHLSLSSHCSTCVSLARSHRAFPPNARAHAPRYQRAADATEIAGPSLSALARVTAREQAPGSRGGGADGGDGGGRSAVHREAWSNLASMYALGHGVPKCMDTARHILRFLDSAAGAEAQPKLEK